MVQHKPKSLIIDLLSYSAMKRVMCCALLCIFLIATVSALNLTKTSVPGPQFTVAATQQIIVKPGVQLTFSPSATSTEIQIATVQINSNPSGAEIWGNNNYSGYNTPYFIQQMPPLYSFNLFLKYPGYEPYHVVIYAQPGEAVVISADLVPLPATTQPVVSPTSATQTDNIPTNAPVTTQQILGQPTSSGSAVSSSESTGSLSVTTTPSGAAVYVDNEMKGISPTMISGISPGTHALKISKVGFQDFSTTITIEAGKVREYSTGLTAVAISVTPTTATSVVTNVAKSPGFAEVTAIAAVFCLAVVRKRSR
jgi:hypothetical protein